MRVRIEVEEHLQEDDAEEQQARDELGAAAPGSGVGQGENLSGLQPPRYQMALQLRLCFSRCCMYTVHTFNRGRNCPLTCEVREGSSLQRLLDFRSS